MTLPDLTILIGPFTRASLAINDQVRTHRGALGAHGVTALPVRVAGRAAQALALDEAPPDARLAAYAASILPIRPVLWSALSFLGSPNTSIHQRELFPDMAKVCLGLAGLPARPRIVIAIEPLHQFFAAVNSAPLARRVAATPWEVLYELSWADLIGDMVAILPDHEVCVVTPDTALCRAPELAGALFGDGADVVDAGAFQRAHLSEDGQAALAAMDAEHMSEAVLRELGARLGNGPDARDLEARFGIEGLTATLLDQRFEEDLARIADMPGVRVW